MEIKLIPIILGLILSLFYGIGSWLKWQSMKNGTIIPNGALTGKYGNIASFIIKSICLIIILYFIHVLHWWIIASGLIMFFLGNWIATILERKLYCNDLRLDTFVFIAEQYTKERGAEEAAHFISLAAPKWWIKLMPMYWQRKLRERLAAILLPELNDNAL